MLMGSLRVERQIPESSSFAALIENPTNKPLKPRCLMKPYPKKPSRAHADPGLRVPSPGNVSRLGVVAILAVGLASSSAAPVAMSDSLQGWTGNSTTQLPTGSGLEVGNTGTGEQINFDTLGAKFGVNNDGDPTVFNHPGPDGILGTPDDRSNADVNASGVPGRNSIRTIDKTYATVNFDAYVTLDTLGTNLEAWLGMGSASYSGWNEPPDTGDAVWLKLRNGVEFWNLTGSANFVDGVKAGPTNKFAVGGGNWTATGPVRMKMSYNAAAKTAIFSFDVGYDGTFVADKTLAPVSTKGLFGEKGSAIFFGTRSNAIMKDFLIDNVSPAGPPPPAPTDLALTLKDWTGTSQSNRPAQASFLTAAGLEAAFVWADGDGAWERVTFDTTNGATFGVGNAGIEGRNTIRTIEQNYDTVSFVSQITIQSLGTDFEGIFGLGSGNFKGGGGPTAPVDNAVYLRLRDNNVEEVYSGVKVGPSSTTTPVSVTGDFGASAPIRMQMVYNIKSRTAVFSFDTAYDGSTFTPDVTLAPISTADILKGSRASVFFSGRSNVVFSDFSITKFTALPFDIDLSLKDWTGTSQSNQPAQASFLTAAGLEAAYVWGGGEAWEQVNFNSSGANFGVVKDTTEGRNTIRTIENDYDSVSFDAFVTVSSLGTNFEAWLGLGNGNKVGWQGNSGADSVLLNLRSNAGDQLYESTKVSGTGTTNNTQWGAYGATAPLRMKMSYDAVAKTATFSFDNNYDGVTFTPDYTLDSVDTSDLWTGTQSARVFFGSRSAAILTDFKVTKTTATSDFTSWASSQVPQVTGGPTGDSDNDGVQNLVEYALIDGGERGSFDSATQTVSFTKRAAPYGTDITTTIEESDDLGISDAWLPVTPTVSGNTISYTLPTGKAKVFSRLKVIQN
jgi:hypothetical protein